VSRTSGAAIITFALISAGCQRQGSAGSAVARIDNQTITLDDVHVRLDSAGGYSQAQLQQYLQRWLRDELLYREALARGLGSSKEIDDRLEDARRQLVINALLDKEIYSDQASTSSPEEIRRYYSDHKMEFVVRSDVALVSYIVFSDRDAANDFRNIVLKGTMWQVASRQILAEPQKALKVLTKGDSVFHTQASLLPPELWRVASSISIGVPSFPVGTTEGYYVFMLWQITKQGQQADLKLVEDEIRSRLSMELRSHRYNALVENLRAKHSVQLLVGSESSDTVRAKGSE
jgi:hypothetical protein